MHSKSKGNVKGPKSVGPAWEQLASEGQALSDTIPAQHSRDSRSGRLALPLPGPKEPKRKGAEGEGQRGEGKSTSISQRVGPPSAT